MSRLTKGRSRKAGLPPGTLVHLGVRHPAETRLTVVQYGPEGFSERIIQRIEEIPRRRGDAVTWLNVDGLHDVSLLDRLGAAFGLHPLVMEDVPSTDQRPKVEDYGDYLYIVLRRVGLAPPGGEAGMPGLVSEQVSIVLGADFVLTFQEGAEDDFAGLRARLGNHGPRQGQEGPDHLAYLLLDRVVDDYFRVLERFDNEAETLEERIVARPEPRTLADLHRLRRELLVMRRAVWPLRDLLVVLTHSESALVRPAVRLYLRDVQDHALYAIDTVETLRELLAGMLEVYLSSLNFRSNEVIRVLTILGAVFLPPMLIASLYGMNFRHMPELEWLIGYPLSLLAMGAAVAGMLAWFRRKKWL